MLLQTVHSNAHEATCVLRSPRNAKV